MKRSWLVLLAAAAVIAIVWMGYLYTQRKHGNLDTAEFRDALEQYLSAKPGLNMAAMDMEIISLQQRGDQADAVVAFRAKQGGASMEIAYHLERKGNVWVVQGSAAQGMNHPSTGAAGPTGAGDLPASEPPANAPSNPPK